MWWRDNEKRATCCQRATDEDIKVNRDAYDCTACELMDHLEGLFRENAEAWDLHHLLCGRTVRDCRLEGQVFSRVTDGWSTDQMIGILDRLNLIASVLEPHGRPQN